ncbi:MAG: FAD-dependent oxidoreductase [Methanomassiliicoccales archaeon]|nr:FAD-dependent oxidoreductase [Methanomassiliicoccales archaeon]
MSIKPVAVIGGGISGVQAALDVANAGVRVLLIERGPALGGHMAKLDKTFPTNDCSACILSPKLVEASRHPLITIMTMAEVIALDGEAPNFKLTVRRTPRYVREDRCVACGACAEKCPVKVLNEFDEGMSERKAIYLPYPQATPLKYLIDSSHCLYLNKKRCGVCSKICPANAVDFDERSTTEVLEVSSVIVAAGFELLTPQELPHLQCSQHPRILTSLEFERLLSASGPTGGKLVVPSINSVPKRIVFAQCVGSRDLRFRPYCSRFCCMASIKQGLVALEHDPSIQSIWICHMGLRTYGKGFDRYLARARREGIKFVKGKVAEILENGEGLQVRVENVRTGTVESIEADMVVLAVAASPPKGLSDLAKALGIKIAADGFIAVEKPFSVKTTRDGVYAAGCCTGPKDISDSVATASAAASYALMVSRESWKLESGTEIKTVTEERKIEPSRSEERRVGVFVCRCGTNIASVVDIDKVVEALKNTPGVSYVNEHLFMCSDSALKMLSEAINQERLNRIVIASCTPRTHESLFRASIEKSGLNPYLFEMVNIREHCAWVHMKEKEKATKKAITLIRAAIAKALLLEPLEPGQTDVTNRALVVGGGPAGLKAASDLLRQGFEVVLVEKSDKLGGSLLSIEHHDVGPDQGEVLRALISPVNKEKFKIWTNCTVKAVNGGVGDFSIVLSNGIEIHAGVIILAPGASLKCNDQKIIKGSITSVELDEKIRQSESLPDRITFIQCIGARNETRGCSRFCCYKTLHQAIELRRRGKEVNILYTDLMYYERGAEELYYEACLKGVRFFEYDTIIDFQNNRLLFNSVHDGLISLETDLVVEVDILIPGDSIADLSKILRVSTDEEGFFLEKHPKLAPVEFSTEGLFVAGCAQYPKNLDEAITAGSAAAAKAATILSHKRILTSPMICVVDESRCRGCGECEAICKFGAARLITEGTVRKSRINGTICKGCGTCAASCPANAIEVKGFTHDQMKEMITALLEGSE